MQASGSVLENFKECPVLQKGVPKHQEWFLLFIFYLAIHKPFIFSEWILCQLLFQKNVCVLFYLTFLQVLKWEQGNFYLLMFNLE